MRLVVDAGVAVKWFLRMRPDEPFIAEADSLAAAIDQVGTTLLAPSHWMAEVVAVIARTEPGVVNDVIVSLYDMRPEIVADAQVLRRAAAMAIDLEHHLFDTLYHAVALEMEATLITADARYFAKAEALGGIRMLGTWTG